MFLGIIGTPWDHPQGCSLISKGMGGQVKKIFFSDFGLHALVHREFQKVESGIFFCFISNLQRYTVLALWGVINVPKDDLIVLYFLSDYSRLEPFVHGKIIFGDFSPLYPNFLDLSNIINH